MGPLPYWDLGFGDLDAEELAEIQTALTDLKVMEALAELTERLQASRGQTLLTSLLS
jgi:hypothetical protein